MAVVIRCNTRELWKREGDFCSEIAGKFDFSDRKKEKE